MRKRNKRAIDLAIKSLRECYGDSGIYAGANQFQDYWARDSFFASFGSLLIGDSQIVRANLEKFIENQREDGCIPLRIGAKNMLLKLAGISSRQVSVYEEDKCQNRATDSSTLFCIALAAYASTTKDYVFAKKHLTQAKKALRFTQEQYQKNTHLIKEKEYAGWMDSVKKKGYVFYSNLCNWKAHKDIAELCRKTKDKDAKKYSEETLEIKKEIKEKFWNGNYFNDWIDEKTHNNLAVGENAFAVIWDLANKEEAKKILGELEQRQKNDELSKAVYPAYPAAFSHFGLRAAGMGDYHSKLIWLWTSCAEAIAQHKTGEREKAAEILNRVSKQIIADKTVFEVHSKTVPVKRLFYRAEHPFAWNAGMYIFAHRTINAQKK